MEYFADLDSGIRPYPWGSTPDGSELQSFSEAVRMYEFLRGERLEVVEVSAHMGNGELNLRFFVLGDGYEIP